MSPIGSSRSLRQPRRPVWYREELARVSIAQLRARFTRQRFRVLSAVELEHAGHAVQVRIVQQLCPTAHGGLRRWLLCPRCGGRAQTVGCHPELGWACPAPACVGGWKGRTRRKLLDVDNGDLTAGDFILR